MVGSLVEGSTLYFCRVGFFFLSGDSRHENGEMKLLKRKVVWNNNGTPSRLVVQLLAASPPTVGRCARASSMSESGRKMKPLDSPIHTDSQRNSRNLSVKTKPRAVQSLGRNFVSEAEHAAESFYLLLFVSVLKKIGREVC
jgi:hypothetical protein